MSRIPLAELIEELRRELVAAAAAGQGEKIRFDLGEVELEVQVVVSREGGGKAGFKLWVVDAELGGKAQSSAVHKVKVLLRPRTASGEVVALAAEES